MELCYAGNWKGFEALVADFQAVYSKDLV